VTTHHPRDVREVSRRARSATLLEVVVPRVSKVGAMLNSKLLFLLCFSALTLATTGCGTDHPDLKPGDQLGVDDILDGVSGDPIGSQTGGGQVIGAPPTSNNGGSGGSGAAAAVCGNGVIEAPEMCDGANLGTASCAQLVGGGGTLLCDPSTCTFDDSMCLTGAGGGGGGTGG
jgi:hypothetical protein